MSIQYSVQTVTSVVLWFEYCAAFACKGGGEFLPELQQLQHVHDSIRLLCPRGRGYPWFLGRAAENEADHISRAVIVVVDRATLPQIYRSMTRNEPKSNTNGAPTIERPLPTHTRFHRHDRQSVSSGQMLAIFTMALWRHCLYVQAVFYFLNERIRVLRQGAMSLNKCTALQRQKFLSFWEKLVNLPLAQTPHSALTKITPTQVSNFNCLKRTGHHSQKLLSDKRKVQIQQKSSNLNLVWGNSPVPK